MRKPQRRFGVDRTPRQIVRNFAGYVVILILVLTTPLVHRAPYFLFNILGTALSCATIVVVNQMFGLVTSWLSPRRRAPGAALAKIENGRGARVAIPFVRR